MKKWIITIIVIVLVLDGCKTLGYNSTGIPDINALPGVPNTPSNLRRDNPKMKPPANTQKRTNPNTAQNNTQQRDMQDATTAQAGTAGTPNNQSNIQQSGTQGPTTSQTDTTGTTSQGTSSVGTSGTQSGTQQSATQQGSTQGTTTAPANSAGTSGTQSGTQQSRTQQGSTQETTSTSTAQGGTQQSSTQQGNTQETSTTQPQQQSEAQQGSTHGTSTTQADTTGTSGTSGTQGTAQTQPQTQGTTATPVSAIPTSSESALASAASARPPAPPPSVLGNLDRLRLTDPKSAMGKNWKLIEVHIDKRNIDFDRKRLNKEGYGNIFMFKFDKKNITGVGAPNRFSAPYEISESDSLQIKIEELQQTLMTPIHHPEKLREQDYFLYMQNIYKIGLFNKYLVLQSKSHNELDVIMVFSN